MKTALHYCNLVGQRQYLARYKAEHQVTFPSFAFLCDFISKEARALNDTSFRLLMSNTAELNSAKETDASQEKDMQDGSSYTAGDVKKLASLHEKPHHFTGCR